MGLELIIKAVVTGYGGGSVTEGTVPAIVAFGNYIGEIDGESNPNFMISILATSPNLNQVINDLVNAIVEDAASKNFIISNNEILFPELRTL